MLAIGVIGSGCCDFQAYRAAEEVGRLLAEAGAVVVCGGLGGVMEAACRGAKLAGGRTLGILPGTDAAQANPYVDIPIVTGMGEARNQILARTSRALIAVGGEYGTLSEIAFALKFGRPVVGLRTWQLARGGMPVQAIAEAETPQEAVRLALELARERGA